MKKIKNKQVSDTEIIFDKNNLLLFTICDIKNKYAEIFPRIQHK